MDPLPLLVSVLRSVAPLSTYTSVLLAVHTVSPVVELDVHELTIPLVGITAEATPAPSTWTIETPVVPPFQALLGT